VIGSLDARDAQIEFSGSESEPRSAGYQLRALADRIVDAPYEQHAGRYAFHHKKTWGDPVLTSADGRHHMAFASETRIWEAADGGGRQITTQLEPQFPDQRSRDYWSRRMPVTAARTPEVLELPPWDMAPMPVDRARLTAFLKVQYGAGAACKEVGTLYGRYAVPRRIRADVLRILADVPGFLWRGEVTDRAGRKGVAITLDDREHDQQNLLIFNPTTGELLASEIVSLFAPVRIGSYQLILATDRTDTLG